MTSQTHDEQFIPGPNRAQRRRAAREQRRIERILHRRYEAAIKRELKDNKEAALKDEMAHPGAPNDNPL